jgi:aminopeptidase N
MEYPMMVNDNPVQGRADCIELTDHEIFHTMFPFYMGINETKYGWMDEGWATIGEWLISPIIDTSLVDEYTLSAIERFSGVETDLPIVTLTTDLSGGLSSFLDSYGKPGIGYLYVKDMLGDTIWNKALHYYINQWHNKHPMPYDFFNCMNTGSGKNLNWFWKRWFFDNGVPDLGIKNVSKQSNGYVVTVQCKGVKPVPVDLVVDFRDGTQMKVHRGINVWESSDMTDISVSSTKEVSKITLGTTYDVDVNKKDNVWYGTEK